MLYKAFRTKLKLNDRQATLMAKHAGYARFVFNWGLRLWMSAYEEGLKPNVNSIKKVFTNYVKPQYPWMSELSSRVYQYAFINLGDAFKRFFKGISSYPKFKKKGHHDSFTFDNCGKPFKLSGTRHNLPFVGWVSTFEALPESWVKKVTIMRQAGDWYISFFVEIPQEITPKCRDRIGVDLGINSLATCSDGTKFSNPKAYKAAIKKLARLQCHLSRKVKGSKNRAKCLVKVQKLHQRVSNIRRDTLHKITTFLAKNHSQVVIEDLNVSGMLKNHCLAGSIADASFYEFRRQLGYKSSRYGSRLIIADRFYPSSQLCSNCGHGQKMPVVCRTFECQNCGLVIDGVLNASITLEKSLSLRRLHLWTGCCRQSRTKPEIHINIRLCPGLFKFYRAELSTTAPSVAWTRLIIGTRLALEYLLFEQLITTGVKPLRIAAKGHGTRQQCRTDKFGFPVRYCSRTKFHKGFQTGDIVKSVVTSKKKGWDAHRVE